MGIFTTTVWVVLFLYVAFKFARCIRMVPTQSAYIVERLGQYSRTLGPGFHVMVPFLDRVVSIQQLKEESMEVPPQDCFTKDNVKVEVDGILYLSVINPESACYGVTDYRFAAVQLAQTTTRSVIGTLELDRTFEERDLINSRVIGVLTEVGQGWGIRVHRYEVKNIVPPPSVRDAMERQMGAERDRRALLASAEGQKTARINDSQGRMQEAINRSEGEMRRRINEAEGQAAEILALAQATAESLEKIGAALAQKGGVAATNLRLSQLYLSKLGNLAQPKTSVLLPSDLSAVDQLLDAMGIDPESAMDLPGAAAPVARARVVPERRSIPAETTESGTMPSAPADRE